MLIIIHMQSKQKVLFYELCKKKIIIDFQRSKGGLMFSENDHYFTNVPSEMYLMTKCGKNGIKTVYNYKNKKSIITMGGQNVASESTPSGPLTFVLRATTYGLSSGTYWYQMSDGPKWGKHTFACS